MPILNTFIKPFFTLSWPMQAIVPFFFFFPSVHFHRIHYPLALHGQFLKESLQWTISQTWASYHTVSRQYSFSYSALVFQYLPEDPCLLSWICLRNWLDGGIMNPKIYHFFLYIFFKIFVFVFLLFQLNEQQN